MEKSFGLFFYLKKPKVETNDGIPIYMRITVNGEHFEVSCKRKCVPSRWNPSSGRMIGKGDEARAFNAYLDTLQQKVSEAKRRLIELDKPVAVESLKASLLGRDITPKHMIPETFSHHNEQMATLVPQEYAPGTLERYRTSYEHTQHFIQWKYKMEDMDIKQLDYAFIED